MLQNEFFDQYYQLAFFTWSLLVATEVGDLIQTNVGVELGDSVSRLFLTQCEHSLAYLNPG